MLAFYHNYSAMSNTADMTGGKPIAVYLGYKYVYYLYFDFFCRVFLYFIILSNSNKLCSLLIHLNRLFYHIFFVFYFITTLLIIFINIIIFIVPKPTFLMFYFKSLHSRSSFVLRLQKASASVKGSGWTRMDVPRSGPCGTRITPVRAVLFVVCFTLAPFS
jgi:hypothetical protein